MSNKDKDLLLLTSKIFGSGHYNAAFNLRQALEKQTDYQIDFYDWDYLGGQAYEFILRNAPRVWQILNETWQNDFVLSFSKFQDMLNALGDKTKENLQKRQLWWQIRYSLFDLEALLKLDDYFTENDVFRDKKPDWNSYSKIILTIAGVHSLGYSNRYSHKTYVLVTDYGEVDRAWTLYTPNTFFVPSQTGEDYLRSFKELRDCRIVQSGIPVNPLTKKLNKLNKHDLRKSLGIKAKKFFVLSGGGAGGKYIARLANLLIKNPLPDSEVLIVCGRNEILKQKLQVKIDKNPQANMHLAGYMDNDQLLRYYRAADMVLTKPGGITLTELINLNTPIGIYYTHTQEEGNLDFVKHNRLGLWSHNLKDFLGQLASLKTEDYEYFSGKMQSVAKYDSIEEIVQTLSS